MAARGGRKGERMFEHAEAAVWDDLDYVELPAAGDDARGAYLCSACGYGITLYTELPRCPMCRGTEWERARAHTALESRPAA